MQTFLKKTRPFTWLMATLLAAFLFVSCNSTEATEEKAEEEMQPAQIEMKDTNQIAVDDTTKTDTMPIVPRPATATSTKPQ